MIETLVVLFFKQAIPPIKATRKKTPKMTPTIIPVVYPESSSLSENLVPVSLDDELEPVTTISKKI